MLQLKIILELDFWSKISEGGKREMDKIWENDKWNNIWDRSNSTEEKIKKLREIIYDPSTASTYERAEAFEDTWRSGGGGNTSETLFAMQVAEDLKKGII